MIRKLITLFKLGRKIAKSDILSIASKFKKPPLALTILFKIMKIIVIRYLLPQKMLLSLLLL